MIFATPENPTDEMARYINDTMSRVVYHPFRWECVLAKHKQPTTSAHTITTLYAGQVPLMTCTVGALKHDQLPTLRVHLQPTFIGLYGADSMVERVLKCALRDRFYKWNLVGKIRDVTVALDISIAPEQIVVWRNQLHLSQSDIPNEYGNCRLVDRRQQLVDLCNVDIGRPMISAQFHVHPREAMPLFHGVRGIKNPMEGVRLLMRQHVHSFISESDFPPMPHTLKSLTENPSHFPYGLRDDLSYRTRLKFLILLSQYAMDFSIVRDGEWDTQWREALLRHKCVSMFAA